MSVFLSPGVQFREIDLSLYIPNLSTTALGMVGIASKGPINNPQFISDPVQFSTIFGDPADPGVEFQPATYAALQYLHTGRQLWFVRVAEADANYGTQYGDDSPYLAKFAKTTFAENSTPPVITGAVNTLVTLTNSNKTMHFVIDGVGPGFDVVFTTGTVSIPTVVSALNTDATFSTYLVASTSITGSLVITGKVAGSSHSVQISGNNMTTNPFGFPKVGLNAYTPVTYGTGTFTAKETANILGSGATFPMTITLNTNDQLTVNVGTSALTAAPVVYQIPAGTYNTSTAMANALNLIAGFSTDLVASSYNSQVKVALKPASSMNHLALEVTASNDAGQTVFGGINGEVTVQANSTATSYPWTVVTGVNDAVTFDLKDFVTPANDISWPISGTHVLPAGALADVDAAVTALNNITTFSTYLLAQKVNGSLQVTLANSSPFTGLVLTGGNAAQDLFGTQPSEKKDTTTGAIVLTVEALTQGTWGNDISIEVISNYTNSVQTSFNLNVYQKGYLREGYKNLVVTPTSSTAYVETMINGVSNLITVTNGNNNTLFPAATGLNPKTPLTGGSNGYAANDPSLYIGISDGLVKTGLQFFRNPEELDINLLTVPGVSDAAVINELITICQTRGDCMTIVDPPLGYTPKQVVDWVNGAGAFSTDHQAFNSSYAALYWPWLQVYDPINKVKVFTAPSGHIANVYAFTDLVSDPWIAPAGLTRGRLTAPIKAEYSPSAGERDLLYENNINPIATFVRDGINVFGQKTLQRLPTALDRVNVRRMLLYLEKVTTTAARGLLFEPDDQVTWLSFVNLVEPFMQSVKDRRGVTDFAVRCDATTNTSDVLERSEMHANIYIKPTKAAEFIQLNFVLTAQAAVFDELVF